MALLRSSNDPHSEDLIDGLTSTTKIISPWSATLEPSPDQKSDNTTKADKKKSGTILMNMEETKAIIHALLCTAVGRQL
jgi:hypothetical protein